MKKYKNKDIALLLAKKADVTLPVAFSFLVEFGHALRMNIYCHLRTLSLGIGKWSIHSNNDKRHMTFSLYPSIRDSLKQSKYKEKVDLYTPEFVREIVLELSLTTIQVGRLIRSMNEVICELIIEDKEVDLENIFNITSTCIDGVRKIQITPSPALLVKHDQVA